MSSLSAAQVPPPFLTGLTGSPAFAFVVESDVPLPPQDGRLGRVGAKAKYPWHMLGINDSVAVPTEAARRSAMQWAANHGRVFVTKAEGRSIRIWRVG